MKHAAEVGDTVICNCGSRFCPKIFRITHLSDGKIIVRDRNNKSDSFLPKDPSIVIRKATKLEKAMK